MPCSQGAPIVGRLGQGVSVEAPRLVFVSADKWSGETCDRMEILIFPLVLLLLLILLFVGGAALIVSMIRGLFGIRSKPQVSGAQPGADLAQLRLKGSVLNASEHHILQILDGIIAPNHYRILAKVRLSDLVVPSTTVSSAYLASVRIELLVCRQSDWGPVCGIVWRDESETPSARSAPDTGWEKAELPIVRVSLQNDVTPERLAARLTGYVLFRSEAADTPDQESRDSPLLVEAPVADELPEAQPEMDDAPTETGNVEAPDVLRDRAGQRLCPRCYAPMEKLLPEDGRWRCSRYPLCSTIIDSTGAEAASD